MRPTDSRDCPWRPSLRPSHSRSPSSSSSHSSSTRSNSQFRSRSCRLPRPSLLLLALALVLLAGLQTLLPLETAHAAVVPAPVLDAALPADGDAPEGLPDAVLESSRQTEDGSGLRTLEQVYFLPAGTPWDSDQLPQERLLQGVRWQLAEVQWDTAYETETIPWQETFSVSTQTDNPSQILAALGETRHVERQGAEGDLRLDKESLRTAPSALKSAQQQVYARKTLSGLAANDPSLVPPSLEQDGAALSLTGITWTVEQADVVEGVEVPISWQADASYSGTVRRSLPAEYETTAVYTGTLTLSVPTGFRITATYLALDPQAAASHEEPLVLRSGEDPSQNKPSAAGGTLGEHAALPFAVSCGALAGLLLFARLVCQGTAPDAWICPQNPRRRLFRRPGRGPQFVLDRQDPVLCLDGVPLPPEGVLVQLSRKAVRKFQGRAIRITLQGTSAEFFLAPGTHQFQVSRCSSVEPGKSALTVRPVGQRQRAKKRGEE